MKKILIIITIVIAILLFWISQEKTKPSSNRLDVVTTLFPLYDFAKNIGGRYANVTLLLPPGVEAHTFEPKPSDIVRINQADIFIYTGKFMEPWAETIINGTDNKKLNVVDTSQGIILIKNQHEHHHHHGNFDPHIWMDFDNAQKMVKTIADAFVQKDPEHSTDYRKNEKTYIQQLKKLDKVYRKSLSLCQTHEIVYGGHYAFGYLAKRYGLTYIAVYGLSPNAEPSARELIKLVEQIRENHIQFIYYEEWLNPKTAQMLARETGTKLLLLNPAHNISKEARKQNATFISIMEDNLKNLQTGLGCKNG